MSEEKGLLGIFPKGPIRKKLMKDKKVSYSEVYRQFKEIEHQLKDLPEIAILGGEYFPKLLSYPICIAKELCKFADREHLKWLVDNVHIAEEIRLLQKTLEDLKRDLELARIRGET